MPKFRKKPVVVEAEQWFPGKDVQGVRRIREGSSPQTATDVYAFVRTIHGDRIELEPGDWVITEPDGIHHYPCKPDIFEKTYELVEE